MVPFSEDRTYENPDFLQNGIADGVTVRVINPLKVISIDIKDGSCAFRGIAKLELPLDLEIELGSGRQPCQIVLALFQIKQRGHLF